MRICGIDPGYGRTGFAIIDIDTSKKISLVSAGTVTTDVSLAFGERLCEIASDIQKIVGKYKPEQCSIESLFFAKNITTAMKVAESRGVIIYVLSQEKIPYFEYSPLQVKMAVTGDGRAPKTALKSMIMRILGISKLPGKDDSVDAIAIAITHASNVFV